VRKEGLVEFGRGLADLSWRIVATSGTAAALRAAGVACDEVAAWTGAPEVLGGRVKTLHPRVFAGILAGGPDDDADLGRIGAERIDLVAVVLKDAGPGGPAEADIGGHALLRAAAKNAGRVLAVSDPAQYGEVLEALRAGGPTEELRRRLAAEAWRRAALYDALISTAAGLAGDPPESLPLPLVRRADLRYGENPGAAAAWYRIAGAAGVHDAEVVAGPTGSKALSANNVADIDAAAAVVRALVLGRAGVGAAIVKHGNPCGAAVADSAEAAYRAALGCDPDAAYGGVAALSAPVDAATARAIAEVFTEGLVAPEIGADALDALRGRKNLRVVRWPGLIAPLSGLRLRGVAGGLLAEAADETPDDLAAARVATRRAPTADERAALDLAWRAARVVRSNAVVLAWADRTAGIGAGQMSRVDAARLAATKASARAARGGVPPGPLAAASDGVLPFPDSLDVLADAGATAVVQPGGSIRDAEVAAAADARGIAMLLTGRRRFRH
jgi:phosphoribosylaminoimidazolecarboxamide formyltransferase/IMP cyclohydrolase